jgi:copper transport protein
MLWRSIAARVSRPLLLLISLFAVCLTARPAMAHANYVRSIPEADSASPTAPKSVQVWFSEEVAPESSRLTVLDARGARVDNADAYRAPDDARELVVTLKPLDAGTYTVVWETVSAIDGHSARSAFPFIVGAASARTGYAGLVNYVERGARALQPPDAGDALMRTLLLAAFALLAGAFAFSPLVMPVDFRAVFQPRRRRLLWISLLLAGISVALVALVNVARGGTSLLMGRLGLVVLARLVLLALLALMLWRQRDESPAVLLPAALLLLTQSLLSHSAAESQWVAPALADWAHFIFTAIWLGGVAMLALVIAPGAAGQPQALGAVIRRFTPLAMFCVFGVALTGIIQSASFVGSFEALGGTAYGRAILVKAALLLVLVALGAFHRQVISPQLEAWRMRTEQGAQHAQAAARRFRASILIELLVSTALLAAVGALTALPLARDVAIDPAAPIKLLSQPADDLTLTLGITPATVGSNQFDLRLAGAGADPVDGIDKAVLRLKDVSMDMGELEVALQPYGAGHYVGRTNSLAMAGRWQIEAIVRRRGRPDARAVFKLDLR